MAHTPADEYRVQVTPVETGYVLSVEGLREFVVADGYEGSLEHVAGGLIAEEVGQRAEAIAVQLRYDTMEKYRRASPFSWGVLLLGLATLVVAALALILLDPTLARAAGLGAFLLIVMRLVAGSRGRTTVE